MAHENLSGILTAASPSSHEMPRREATRACRSFAATSNSWFLSLSPLPVMQERKSFNRYFFGAIG